MIGDIKIRLSKPFFYSADYRTFSASSFSMDEQVLSKYVKSKEDWALFFLEHPINRERYFQLDSCFDPEKIFQKKLRIFGFPSRGNNFSLHEG